MAEYEISGLELATWWSMFGVLYEAGLVVLHLDIDWP